MNEKWRKTGHLYRRKGMINDELKFKVNNEMLYYNYYISNLVI